MKEYLNPKRPLLDEVADWLCRNRLERTEGAASLAHVMMVVPTAQSGRNLRLALARRLGGVLPPRVVQPMRLVKPAEDTLREATDAELAATFLKFLERLGLADDEFGRTKYPHLFRANAIRDVKAQLSLWDQLSDIWHVLAGGGLVMRDVLESDAARRILENAAGEEVERWRELAELESAFFGFLHERGICHPMENVRRARENPRAIDPEIREVVLPALADPIRILKDVLAAQRPDLRITVLLHADRKDAAKFDEWGRPVTERWIGASQPTLAQFKNADIVLAADTSALANSVVTDFPPVGSTLAPPSLALADVKIFPAVASAFLNAGYVVHNPERHPLAVSSLGRLVEALAELYRPGSAAGGGAPTLPWSPFVAVLRSDDVLKAIVAESSLNRSDILQGIDFAQNRFLPQVLPPDCAFPQVDISQYDRGAYEAFLSAAKLLSSWLDASREGRSLTAFLRQMLRKVFARRTLTGADGEDEFREAASCVWDVLDALECETIAGLELSDTAFDAVVRRVLNAAFYSLEPDSPAAVKTEGWLELSWSAAAEFALVGFHEGAVPDSLVGHAFVPDGLRRALGLTDNDDRLARDTWLLKELLDSHGPHAVRAYVSKTDGAGDICRPSRLLYLCPSDDFPMRVGYLFGDCPSAAECFHREVADRWRLRLPDEIGLPRRNEKTPDGHLSASAIDQYVRCPFTYLLKCAMDMRTVEDKVELGYDDFGSLVHKVLETYAREQIASGNRQLTGVDRIRAALARIAKDVASAYGDRPSVNVALQLDAVAGRIGLFADIQAQWAADGWRIVERPEYQFLVQPFLSDGDDTWIKGNIDRIDYNPKYGYRIIDYKTWDKRKDVVSKHIAKGGKSHTAFAEQHHFPLLADGRRLLSIQLPLYALCLAAADSRFKGKIADMCYLILGEDAENTCVLGSAYPQGDFECQKKNRISLVEIASAARETTRTAIRHIRENIFWPPGPGEEWKYDIRNLLVSTPEKDMGADLAVPPDWLRRQLAKLEACK